MMLTIIKKFPRKYLPRIRKKDVYIWSIIAAIFFFVYQILCLRLLYDEATSKSRIHPKDLNKVNEVSQFISNDKQQARVNNRLSNKLPPISSKVFVTPKVSKQVDLQSKITSKNSHSISIIKNEVLSGQSVFKCKTSGILIHIDRVNDDYCDCPEDGSDEPQTNACENSTFKCKKHSRGFPESVPSGFVNDGVCDCCDGSDEWQNHVQHVTLPPSRQKKLSRHQTPCKNLCNQ